MAKSNSSTTPAGDDRDLVYAAHHDLFHVLALLGAMQRTFEDLPEHDADEGPDDDNLSSSKSQLSYLGYMADEKLRAALVALGKVRWPSRAREEVKDLARADTSKGAVSVTNPTPPTPA